MTALSCHTCQVVGKPNQVIPKAGLQPIPAFDEPYNRIIIDCVGPLPITKFGNEYLLNIMCASTRFAEAIPLRNSRKENPQTLTQLSSRSHPRHLMGKRTAQKDITIDTTSDSQMNSNFQTGGHRPV